MAVPSLAWWNESYEYKMKNNVNTNVPVNLTYTINGSFNLFNPSASQYVWASCVTNCSNYLYFNNNTAYILVDENETQPIPFEIEIGNVTRSDYEMWRNQSAIGVWHLSNHYDSTGLHNLTINGVVYNVTGYIGRGHTFNTTNTNSELYYTPTSWNTGINSWRATKRMTAIALVKFNEKASYSFILVSANGGCGGNTMNMQFWGTAFQGFIDTSDCNAIYFSVGGFLDQLKVNEWYFLAMTYEGNVSGVDYLTAWFGNVSGNYDFRNLTQTVRGSQPYYTNTIPYRIGNRGDVRYPFRGIIDEVRIYNRTLSETELRAIYENFRLSKSTLGQRETKSCWSYNPYTRKLFIPTGCKYLNGFIFI